MLQEGSCSWYILKQDYLPNQEQQQSQQEEEKSDCPVTNESEKWEKFPVPFRSEQQQQQENNNNDNAAPLIKTTGHENNGNNLPASLLDKNISSSARAICIQLSPLPLRLGELYNAVVVPCCGAVSSFIGTTRDVFEGKQVQRLEYEVYGKMAESTTASIAFNMFKKWPDIRRVVISHRSGEVGVCQPSVVIHVSSVHRRQGLEACQYAIDTLKADVPIWKREFYRRERDENENENEQQVDDDEKKEFVLQSKWKSNSECCHGKRTH